MESFLTWLRYQDWFITLNKELAKGSSEEIGVYLVLGIFIIAILVVILLLAVPENNDYEE